MTSGSAPAIFTTGDIERRTGAPSWLIRREIDRMFPDARRVGPYRVLDGEQYAQIERVLAGRGYGHGRAARRELAEDLR